MNEKERELCAEYWLKYEPKLRVFCRAKSINYNFDIDEVLSDTFLALCKKIQSDGALEYPQAWLYKVLNNIILQSDRKSDYEFKHMVDLTFVQNDVEANFEDKLVQKESLTALSQELNSKLNSQEKLLFKLLYYDELKYETIAKMYDINEDAVKQRKYRLKHKIIAMSYKFL